MVKPTQAGDKNYYKYEEFRDKLLEIKKQKLIKKAVPMIEKRTMLKNAESKRKKHKKSESKRSPSADFTNSSLSSSQEP
jgi:hypothetical protein